MHPILTVEEPGFVSLLNKLNPKYQCPTRRHFSEVELPRLYSHVRDSKVKPKLGDAAYCSLTLDLWTSTSHDPYLSVTVHFIDNEWCLKAFCLETTPLYDDHTGTNIKDAVVEILQNWDIPLTRVAGITTDNGSNFIAGFADDDRWLQFRCFGHSLDLAINKGLKLPRVETAVRKCRGIVELFSRSWKRNRDLKEKQEQLGFTSP